MCAGYHLSANDIVSWMVFISETSQEGQVKLLLLPFRLYSNLFPAWQTLKMLGGSFHRQSCECLIYLALILHHKCITRTTLKPDFSQ